MVILFKIFVSFRRICFFTSSGSRLVRTFRAVRLYSAGLIFAIMSLNLGGWFCIGASGLDAVIAGRHYHRYPGRVSQEDTSMYSMPGFTGRSGACFHISCLLMLYH